MSTNADDVGEDEDEDEDEDYLLTVLTKAIAAFLTSSIREENNGAPVESAPSNAFARSTARSVTIYALPETAKAEVEQQISKDEQLPTFGRLDY